MLWKALTCHLFTTCSPAREKLQEAELVAVRLVVDVVGPVLLLAQPSLQHISTEILKHYLHLADFIGNAKFWGSARFAVHAGLERLHVAEHHD